MAVAGRVGFLPKVEMRTVERPDVDLEGDQADKDVVELESLDVAAGVVQPEEGAARNDVGAGRDVRRPQIERIVFQRHVPFARLVSQRRRMEHVTCCRPVKPNSIR